MTARAGGESLGALQAEGVPAMPPLALATGAGVLFGAIYIVLLVTLGIISIRKGHWIMFIIGIFIPLFWIIGALLPPTGAREAY
jgi:hypothetical protein